VRAVLPQSFRREPARIAGALAALYLAIMTAWLCLLGVPVHQPLTPAEIHARGGFSYSADLAPMGGYWVRIPGDTNEAPERASLTLYEDGTALGPAHAMHDDIANSGMGRYSLWSSTSFLIFSTSDNSDPRSNGRTYAISGRATLGNGWLVLSAVSLAAAIALGRPWLHWLSASFLAPVRTAAIIVASTVAAVIVVLIGVELAFRAITPFENTVWPARHVPEVGFLFEPNARVQYTNLLDYWVVSNANSLGFLDREPRAPDPRGCHVAIVGDSMVEAAQVPLEDRLQSQLEAMAAERHPGWRLTASAFGYSGTGQLNQIPFYDRFARAQQPDVVVLVAVANDFANNSTVLESVRNGWHPEHPPRLFARGDTNGAFEFIPVATDWRDHLLPISPPREPADCALCDLDRRLEGASLLYRWVKLKLRLLGWNWGLDTRQPDASMQRKLWLEDHVQPLASGLSAWNGQPDMDAMFNEPRLPPIFEEAVALTGYALDEFKARTSRDGATLVMLTSSTMSGRYLERFRTLTAARGIPLLDQNDWLRRTEEDGRNLHFRHDGHWNARGHEIAAAMVLDFLERHPETCRDRPSR
jgi:hypothetical protein